MSTSTAMVSLLAIMLNCYTLLHDVSYIGRCIYLLSLMALNWTELGAYMLTTIRIPHGNKLPMQGVWDWEQISRSVVWFSFPGSFLGDFFIKSTNYQKVEFTILSRSS